MKRPFSRLAALFFAAFAVVHVIRVVQGWDVAAGGTSIPMWVSYVATVVSGVLAVGLWREAGQQPS